jgi:hypothetical protein
MNWLVTLLTFVPLLGAGQVMLPGRLPAGGDSVTLRYVGQVTQCLELPAFERLSQQRQLRLFTEGVVLDCWQTSTGAYQGQLVNWVQEVSPGGEEPTARHWLARQALAPPVVQAVFAVLDSCHVLTLPDEHAIAGWQPTLDGVGYTVAYRDGTTYRVATYANPALQGALPEAQLVSRFVERLTSLCQVPAATQAFGRTIPYECYTSGGADIVCRVLSFPAQQAYKRDRRRYRRLHPLAPMTPPASP